MHAYTNTLILDTRMRLVSFIASFTRLRFALFASAKR